MGASDIVIAEIGRSWEERESEIVDFPRIITNFKSAQLSPNTRMQSMCGARDVIMRQQGVN